MTNSNNEWHSLGGGGGTPGGVPPVVLEPSVDLSLQPPANGTLGANADFYITPTANIVLSVAVGILVPSMATQFIADSGQALTSGKGYWVKLKHNGTAWTLVSIVGGY